MILEKRPLLIMAAPPWARDFWFWAFALPVLTRLGQHGRARVLVLEPTRELAAQVETAFRDFARFTDIRTVAVFGGVGYGAQRSDLKRGVDIIRLRIRVERGSHREFATLSGGRRQAGRP